MPPKPGKKGSAKKPNTAGAAPVNKNWEAALTKAQFEEDSWQACVSLVVGGSPHEEEEEVMKALAVALQQPQRKLFTSITRDSTLSKIHELGNPKAKKPDDIPLFYEVTEAAKVLLDAGEEIPVDLMAKILKFQLLQIKASDQQRREAEQAEGVKSSITAPSGKDKSGAKVSDKKGKGPQSPVGPSREKKTKLKRRDDVEPPTFIDDEPDDGPHHYVLLLGFYNPHLIGMLDAIGVHVANVVKLCLEYTESFEEQQEQHRCEDVEESLRTSSSLNAEVKFPGHAELAVQARKLDLFWSGLRPVLDSAPPDSKLHDTAQLSYTVSDLSVPFHTQDTDTVLELGSRIFDGVANLIYDCLKWRRQHQHYRDNVKLISVPTAVDSQSAEVVPINLPLSPRSKKKTVQEAAQEATLPLLSTDVDMCYYSNLLDLVPPEACSVPLILHCILEQVVVSAEQSLPALSHMAEEPRFATGPWLDHQLVSYMLQSFLPLVHTEEEKSRLINSLLPKVQSEEDKKRLMETFGTWESQKKSEQPLVIRHHDERALRLRDVSVVQGFDAAEVELSVMRLSPVWELIQSVAQQRSSSSCWMPIKQQLQHYCTDDTVSWPEVERLFHQSVFEAMPLTRLDQQGVLLDAARPLGSLEPLEQQKTPAIIPWDNPLSYAKQQLHNLQTKGPMFLTEDPANTEFSGRVCSRLVLSDMQSCRRRSLFDWHYTEHHSATVFPQVLQLASEEYRCLDTFRGSHKNTLYIFCHNPMSPRRHSKESWDVALHTDVKFRTYLEHVADNVSDWTREEELKTEAMQIRNHNPAEAAKDEEAMCSVKEEADLEPVIRKDSLKAWKLEQERLKEEEMARKSKKESTPKGKQQREEGRKSKTLSGGRTSRPDTAGSSAKTPRESEITTAPPVEENKELHPTDEQFNGFTGYSMDGKLIHVSGSLQHLFPSDGGHITVENISFVGGSSQMKVAVKKDGHSFYTHINQVVVDLGKPLRQPQDTKNTGPKEDCKVSDPVEMRTVKQGSLSAVLDNKIHLSYSFYGPTGEYTVSSQDCSKVTDLGSHTQSSQTRPPESQGCEGKPALPSSPFNSLCLSVPNGLLLQFLPEDGQGVSPEEKGILVRQSFPLHGRGEVRRLQDTSLSREVSRTITSQGAVVRSMKDGSTEVLFADGSVSFSQDSGPVWVPDSEVQEENAHQEAEDKKEQSSEKEAEDQRGCWLTTTPSGDRICTVGTTHEHIATSSLLAFRATDPITHQVMLSREDLVVSVQNPDGSLVVEHADGTRITSLFQDRSLNETPNCLLNTEEQPESVTFKSTSQCECSCTEDTCVTHCEDNIKENMHIQVSGDSGGQVCRNSAGNMCDNEGTEHDERGCADSSVHKKAEQSVFAEETVPENDQMNISESDNGSRSAKERVVLVEKEGCATVVMYRERHMAHMFLADGTIITGNNQGEYQIFPSSVGLLHIQTDGKCVYSSDPPLTPSPKGCTPTNQSGIYTMSHTDKVACDITDPDGNHFQVMDDGKISVLNLSPEPSTLKHDEEELEKEEEEEDRELTRIHANHKEHSPRLFLVHEDGSGTELLSSHTVEELLYQAYSDPTIALLKEPLPGTRDEFGITILKPSHNSVWSQWLLDKQNPEITPPNLRNRSWHNFPRVEKKKPGPPFGADIGRGLTLRERSGGSAAQHQPVRSCPKVLEMREIYQHRPFTSPLKNTIDSRLKEYVESLMEREQRLEEMKVKDPRTEKENAHASGLFNLILSFAEEDSSHHTINKRVSADAASLYSQGVRALTEQSDASEDTAASDSWERIPSFSDGKNSKWAERLSQYRQEMSEERTYREALRKKNIVPFFHTENYPLYQSLQQHPLPDLRSLSMDLPPIPKSDSTDTFLKDAPQEDTPRPLNPTPSQSASHAAGSDRKPKKRPTNPTPQTAGESSRRASSSQCKSVEMDVTGKPRRSKVRLPTSILGSKPCSVPNQQFLTVEEPVRRKCRTISLTDPNTVVRGFHLLPSSVDFGTLQEGTYSVITVVMKNVGVDTCRFHVKQPPPPTGLRVVYNPGPVAAGLQVELQVQLFAMCAPQAGEAEPRKYISQDVIIHTETDILYLPVTATILPERLYETWLRDHSRTHRKKSSRVSQPSSSSGNHTQTNPSSPDQSHSKRRTF